MSAPISVGGKTQYNITGGTRPGGGGNLFHSFGDFNVPNNNIANFLNDSGLTTANILGRVTGGNISNIFGTIQTTGFNLNGVPTNLFLINPTGFLFGPNATVNVGGMVSFSSADYLRLADGKLFNAVPNPAADAVLSTAPVAAYGFLGSSPGAITVQGSQLSVTPGQTISLVGGNITVQSGVLDDGVTVQSARLSAPGGQINLASVASPGEVLSSNMHSAPNINGQSFTAMGNINLSQGTLLDVSADAAGTIQIRGGQLTIADATLSADTGNSNGASKAVDINVTGDVTITDTRGMPAITARTSGSGDAGEIRIASSNLTAKSTFADFTGPFTLIDSHTAGEGKAGNVTITTGDLAVTSQAETTAFIFIDSGTAASGHGGDVNITGNNIVLGSATINTGDNVAFQQGLLPTGSAGNLNITADTLQLRHTTLITDAFQALLDTQQGGDITINARQVTTGDSAAQTQTNISAFGFGHGGAITINADSISTDITLFQTVTVSGAGGGITLNARQIQLANGSSLISDTYGDGRAGDIHVTASEQLSLLGVTGSNPQGIFRPSGIFSNSFGLVGNGNAGNVIVNTPVLVMNQGRINTSTASSGRGGDVIIHAGSISMSGEFPNPDFVPEPIFGITDIHPSGIFTKTVGGACSGVCGDAGQISITTGSLTMGNGSQIDSGTSSTGHGGDISIHATDTISMSGTLSNGNPVGIFSRTVASDPGSGNGGNISIVSGQSVNISNGASVSASSTGPGNTGNITINAGNQLSMTNASVTTEASQSGGGTIKITTNPGGNVRLTNSTISASVLDGTGGGGSVNIDPDYVVMTNSSLMANAVFGPGGNILVTTNLLLPDSTSIISASSAFGQQGTITIQSPVSPASGKIVPLGQQPLIPTALLSQRCAALAGGNISSFTVAGRDTLPAEPSGWLSSPLALGQFSESKGMEAKSEHEPPLLSLRQIAPPGFLTQVFAVDSSGCQS